MSKQGHLKGLPDPEPLGLRIATKAAFLASRTAKDAAISTLAQESAEHTRLQEIHRGLILQLEEKETQILRMRKFAINAQAVSTEKELELQRVAESALSTLQHEETEHARLKERYRNCIAELERKDAEILNLHGKIKDLSEEHNNATHAAHTASTEHEVELDHLRTIFEGQSAELEEKSSQITELNGTIERLTQEFNDLQESENDLREALAERTRDLKHATDAAAESLAEHTAEEKRLQDLIHQQTTQLEDKEAQVLELQETSESLAQENSTSKSRAARTDDSLAAITKELKCITADALAKITTAKAVKAATEQRVTELTNTVENLEKEALRREKELRDAAQTQSKTEWKRRDAVDKMLKVQATSDQLTRDNALLSTEVDRLQARKESLVKTLTNESAAHARTKEVLCNATETVSELRTSKAAGRNSSAVLAARVQRLERDYHALAAGELTQLEHPSSITADGTQNVPLPGQEFFVYDDEEFCDWNDAKASGTFDFWSRNLHGSEIMSLIPMEEVGIDSSIACIPKLIFDQESGGLAGWLAQRHQDSHFEEQRLNIVHLLNDSLGHYGCTCHRMHIYPDGSKDQDVHARCALDLLRAYGKVEDVSGMLVAVLSCFSGRSCLETLVEFDIHLNRSDCEILTQKCQDKLRGVLV